MQILGFILGLNKKYHLLDIRSWSKQLGMQAFSFDFVISINSNQCHHE